MIEDRNKILITIQDNDVSPRFDLTTEVVMAIMVKGDSEVTQRTMVLPQASAEELCHLILTENVSIVVCGGIEDEFYQYLTWKKVKVFDSVVGPWQRALNKLKVGGLEPGAILFDMP